MPLLTAGQVLNNRYRIVAMLSRGGFGAVYRAWDLTLNGPCAVKESSDTSPEAVNQFQREAQLLFKLRHPNLPRVTDFFVIPGEGQYLVMDFIEGEDLWRHLKAAGGPLPVGEVVEWMMQVCKALEYLHSRTPPIIHRDVKPHNIILTPEGEVMLVDFGISKVFDPNLPTPGGARGSGTPPFAPLEQYGRGGTDARSDVYALGVMLYLLLTGQEPPESVDRVGGVSTPLPHVLNPAIGKTLGEVILKAMEVRREDRHQSVSELRHALESIHRGKPAPQPTAPVRKPARPARQKAAYTPTAPVTAAAIQSPAVPAQAAPRKAKPGRKALPRWLLAVGAVPIVLGLLAVLAFAVLIPGIQRSQARATLRALTATVQSIIDTRTVFVPTATPTRRPTATLNASIISAQVSPVDGMQQVLVPAGGFTMGSEMWKDAQPVHYVYLDAFWMDRTEVTNSMYALCVEAGMCTPPQDKRSATNAVYYGNSIYDAFPVVYVDWNQANAYCTWAGRRLPSEAEWEKAARGTDERTYPWGEYIDCNWANFKAEDGFCVGENAPVGSYPGGVSPYGVLDMAGNVWEWVADVYGSKYYEVSPGVNPPGPGSGDMRVRRGGCWGDKWDLVRTYIRDAAPPESTFYDMGFRCAVNADAP